MGRCRVVQPDIVRLEISDGDWLDVKKDLTYGERMQASSAVIGEIRVAGGGNEGYMRPQFELAALAQILAYLVDWSLVDAGDKRIPIVTQAQKLAALKSLDDASVDEIGRAIDAHAERRAAEIADAKNNQAGTPVSAAT